MSHYHYRTTYGNKNHAEIQALEPKVGDTVFNTDIFQREFCINKGGAKVWTNGQCVVMSKDGHGFQRGDCLTYDSSTGLTKVNNTSTDVENGFGVVHRAYANVVVVAITGIYPVKFDEETSKGEYGQLQASPAGTCNGTTTSSKGTIGQIMETTTQKNGDIRLVKVFLTYCERA